MGIRILIAEDDPNIANLLLISLTGRGYDIYSAKDGQEALERLSEVKPNVLITDVMMPRMNGFQLVNAVRDRYDVPTPKIIILTSRSADEDVQRGLNVGADMYIPKPFDIEEIPLRVAELLGGPKG
jgi:DNA-binding response OmpR family regulator